ncbi:farnesyl diphosphate synthase [Silanimonas lenta]|uniref:farnesyl diphosphate synthase n=1 Tax=Silanimonas lenta TaxID=265429 RepID=UPI00048DD0BB
MASEPVLGAWRRRIDGFLDRALSAPARATRLHEAMRYAVLGEGKRLRPLLVYAAAAALGRPPQGEVDALDHAAAAVELVHAYSLVHDDLPAMDDDALRRGRPTVHVAFDEAIAILAGDALQAEAFALLAAAPAPAEARVAALAELAQAAGLQGMCGGQAIDMALTGHEASLEVLADMHRRKTGALIEAAVLMGGRLAGADAARLSALREVGALLGLAFQIKDDLLDAEADSATLGKTAGKDAAQGKSTYVNLLGLDGARARLEATAEALQAALAQLRGLTDGTGRAAAGNGDGQALADLAVMAVRRAR